MASNGTDTKADNELMQLKAIVAAQQQRLDALEVNNDAPVNGSEGKEQRATRRQMLRLAGAALAGAAGSAALRAIPASAADGDTMTVGSVKAGTSGAATGVTDGTILRGVRFFGTGTRTSSIIMATERTKRVRFIDTVHIEGGPDTVIRF